jgi:hypothetical protein
MLRGIRNFAVAIVMLTCCVLPARGQGAGSEEVAVEERTKLAQTSMQFLSVSVDARASALAGAVTAEEGGAVSMLYNPASMGFMQEELDISLGQTEWISNFSYNFGAVAYRPLGGRFGTIGISVVSVDYGNFQETIRADNEQGFLDIGNFSPSATAAGIGYGRSLSDRFAFGGNVKYARQSLGSSVVQIEDDQQIREDYAKATAAFDFGVLYHTRFRSLAFGVSLRNFSTELTYAEESFELPLTFEIGTSMDLMDLAQMESDMHSIAVNVDWRHPRDFSEQIKVGGEYVFMNTLALRAGYVYPESETGLNLGAGLQQMIGRMALGVDYAYTEFGLLGNVHRLAASVSLR